jgi:UDPglucose--hexose-1-phosphate uridylyltransferase
VPAFDPDCPFCPGNESMLPDIVEERRAGQSPGWRTRVVPNKFPALFCDTTHEHRSRGIYTIATGRGCHEVVIETPRHDADLTTLSDEEAAAVIEAYRERYLAHMQHPNIRCVVVFRNRGERAGASLRHPHSQIIATSMVPPAIEARQTWARQQYEDTGRCALCEILSFEADRRERLVIEGDHFLAIVPFAAAGPCELRLVPKRHQASFSEIREDEQAELARLLRRILLRLERVLDDPSYNYAIESASKDETGSKSNPSAPHLHWYLRILPNLVRPGGFELASGLAVNPSVPEADAERLRNAVEGREEPFQ